MYATSQADKYDLSPAPTQAQRDWLNAHWDRAIIYMDQIAAWLTGDWGYVDVLAIYTTSSTATAHPEWILKDAAGNKLTFYSSVQYLGDIGNPAYQDYVAAKIGGMASRSYKGVHCDDVDLDRVVVPSAINPRTNAVYTLADWQHDFANMMTKVRVAAPKPFEVVHNSLYWAGTSGDVARCIKQADVFEVERGFNDAGDLTKLMAFADTLHSWGIGLNYLSETAGVGPATFNLACALLCSNGHDYQYSNYGWQPDSWWALNDANLGAAKGPRYQSGNVLRRDFANGWVTADLPAKIGTVTVT
jgi:hypothetical protein